MQQLDEGAGGLHACDAGRVARVSGADQAHRRTRCLASRHRSCGVQIVAGRYYILRTPSGAQSSKLYVRDGVQGADDC